MAVFNRRRYQLLSIADTAIALFLTFPFTCMFWRGIWDLIGWYVLRDHTPLNHWVQTLIGLLQMVGLLVLPLIERYLDPSKKLKFWIVTRIFMYLHTLTFMFYWHGFWELLNFYLPITWESNVLTLAVSYLCLVLLGGCRSTMWPPFFIIVDKPDLFQCANRFGTKAKSGRMLDYVSDAFVAQLIVLGIAIICWRSSFNLFDALIFPGEKFKSDAVTAVVGTVGCVLLLSLQVPLGKVSASLARRPLLKLAWEDGMYLLVFAVLALMWRGVWNLNAEYMIKEVPLGAWVNHAVGAAGLVSMQTLGEVSAFGMIRDGQDPGGEAFFPIHYLRHFMKSQFSKEEDEDKSEVSVPDEAFDCHTNPTFADIPLPAFSAFVAPSPSTENNGPREPDMDTQFGQRWSRLTRF